MRSSLRFLIPWAFAALTGCSVDEKNQGAGPEAPGAAPGGATAAGTSPLGAGTAGYSLGQPLVHENLAIYTVRGGDTDSRDFITLDEGLEAGSVVVREKGAAEGQDQAQVDELEIENKSDKYLFLQAGDVVKGGKQDRTIAGDLVLAPRSGSQPLVAFCVEHGRWSAGGTGSNFSSNTGIVSGNEIKLAIQDKQSQEEVWNEVAQVNSRSAVVTNLSSPGSSLLAVLPGTGTYNAVVENKKLQEERDRYVADLLEKVGKDPEAMGIVVAVNGEVKAADVYGSRALFRKIARKLVASYALDAALSREVAKAAPPAPTSEAARAFLAGVEKEEGKGDQVTGTMHRRTRETQEAVLYEYRELSPAEAASEPAAKEALHRTFLRK